MEEKFLEVNGINISYYMEGKGEDVVLFIHGLGGYKENWELNIPFFIEKYRVIAVDLPGFGHSQKPDVDYGIEFFARFLVEFIKKLNINKVDLVGNSMGGHISLMIALKNPVLVKKVVLVDAAGANIGMPPDFMMEQWGNLQFDENMVRIFIGFLFFRPSKISERMVKRAVDEMNESDYGARQNALLKSGLSIIMTNLSDRLKEINIPTLIIWGSDDKLLNIENAYFFKGNIKDSVLVVFDECGHVPMLEYPQRFNQEVERFLSI